MRPGDVLASRYRLTVLLHDRNGGRFWRAHDLVLARDVALHLIPQDDPRGPLLEEAARRSATVQDPRLLRVLDSNSVDGLHYVVNEWGEGVSLNHLVEDEPLSPVRAAWLVAEVASMVSAGHNAGVAHGRLVPENVLIDTTGAVKVIGFAVDAALHGLPPGRTTADLTDLGGLLYAALTGRWAGVSESAVPAAPLEHGRPLRPRQVRAGVPRLLDGMCESLLGGGTRFASAAEIAEALNDYVGDPAIVAEAEALRIRTGALPAHRPGSGDTDATGAIPAVPAASTEASGPSDSSEPEETMLVDVLVEDEADDVERTQVGSPVFDDLADAAVADPDWHTPSEVAPAPPPPFEEPPERPLFAPDPPEGRLRRLPPPTADDRGYWPFGRTGELPAVAAAHDGHDGPEGEAPGRSWLRIALVLLAVLALVPVAYVVAGLLQDDGDTSTGSGSNGPSDGATVVRTVIATAFDPHPGDNEEHDSEARLAVDRDPGTSWTTSGYDQNFGPGGLKPGVGLVLDLGSSQAVSSITVTVGGGPTTIQLLAAGETPPTTADGLAKAAEGDGSGTVTLTPQEPLDSRYVVLWLTSVPQVDGEFRGAIAEVEVRA